MQNTMIKKTRFTFHLIQRFVAGAAVALAIAAPAAVAAEAPDAIVKRTTDAVLGEFEARRDELKADQGKLFELVADKVLPHMDFKRMSRMVLGRNWKKASPEQQVSFTEEFKSLLVRTYATALFEYSGQPIEYKPFRLADGADDAEVKTMIDAGGGPKIPLSYSLAKDADAWKVYDVSIDGISLVTNYRTSYTRIVKKNGIDGLIKQLAKKNAELSGS